MDSSRSSTLVNTCLGLNLFPAVDDDSPHATSLMMDRDDNERPPPLQDIVTTKVKDQFEGKYDIFERDDLQSLKQEKQTVDGAVQMAEELNRITLENKRLIEMLTVVCKSYNDLETHVKELMTTEQHLMPASNELMLSAGNLLVNNKKRKSPTANDLDLSVSLVGFGTNNTRNTDHQTRSSDEESYKRPSKEMMTSNIVDLRISRVYVRCDASDTSLIVKDGFQWRKYGQKVTRDNPSPRAYYRCSFAPSCPVKKKVQKSAENPCLLVATYEGEHNHVRPAGSHVIAIDHKLAPKISSPSSNSSSSPMSSISSCVLDCLNPNQQGRESEEITARANIDFKQLLVQQMASSLTKDANFTTALAAAVSAGRFTHQPHPPPIPKW